MRGARRVPRRSTRPRPRRRCRSTTDDGHVVLALVRGDDRLSEAKLLRALGRRLAARRPTRRSAPRSAPRAARSARSASTGEVVADETLREGQFVAGANRDGWHLRGVEAGRDYEPRFADIREPREGDRCPECGGALQLPDRDRGRPHLQLRRQVHRRRSARRSSTRTAREKPLARGQLRDRPRPHNRGGRSSRTTTRTGSLLAASRSRRTTSTSSRCRASRSRPRRRARALEAAGLDVLLDDRDLRAGREVRRRRPDRRPDAGHRRQEDARGRRGRRPRPRDGRGAPCSRCAR